MRVIQRRLVAVALLLFGAIAVWSPAGRVYGQTTVPSAEQIDVFKSLTPEQQDAILRQMGGAGGSLGSAGTGSSTGERQGQAGQRSGQETDQDRAQRPLAEGEETQRGVPVLKGEDWVIIEADYHLGPRPLSQSLQALAIGQGVS